jgi:hypothetical protein
MADIYPPARQREALLKLVEALGCWDRALKRDERGAPRPSASTDTSMRSWERSTGPRARASRCISARSRPVRKRGLVQEGAAVLRIDAGWWGKGLLFLDRLPTAKEAEVIRGKLGIRKRAQFDEETLTRKREAMRKARAITAPESPWGVPGGQIAAE